MGKYFCIIFLLTIYSCNLNVVDTNNPDRSSVFSNPIKIETLAKNAFLSYWQVTHGNLINGVNVKANLYATSLVAANQYTFKLVQLCMGICWHGTPHTMGQYN